MTQYKVWNFWTATIMKLDLVFLIDQWAKHIGTKKKLTSLSWQNPQNQINSTWSLLTDFYLSSSDCAMSVNLVLTNFSLPLKILWHWWQISLLCLMTLTCCIFTKISFTSRFKWGFNLWNYVQGVWGNGAFLNMEDLCKTLTTMMFILTNVHAAANFNQYDEYAYPPNFPFRLDGAPPTEKVSNLKLKMTQKMRNY